MSYSIYTEHPESAQRRQEDWTAWSFWAMRHAPWTGAGLTDVVELMKVICSQRHLAAVCEKLDLGGVLTPAEVAEVIMAAYTAMTEPIKRVFVAAAENGYGVRVDFSRGAFGAPSASEYLAKSESDTAH
jgi:hypothetical protein